MLDALKRFQSSYRYCGSFVVLDC